MTVFYRFLLIKTDLNLFLVQSFDHMFTGLFCNLYVSFSVSAWNFIRHDVIVAQGDAWQKIWGGDGKTTAMGH